MNVNPNSISPSPLSVLHIDESVAFVEEKNQSKSANVVLTEQSIKRTTRTQLSKEIKNQNLQKQEDSLVHSLKKSMISTPNTLNGFSEDCISGFYDSLLINEEKMRKLVEKNPWDVDINQPLDEFLGHVKRSGNVNFRVGGRILHSASHVVRVKSDVMVNDSANVRDTFQACENESDQCQEDGSLNYEEELMNEAFELIEQTTESENFEHSDNTSATGRKQTNKTKKGLSDEELIKAINSRENILVPTNRCLYSKIELSELSHSLDLVIKNRLLRDRKNKNKESIEQVSNKNMNDTPKNLVLPTNFIKNKEEARMFMEQMIESTLEKIKSLYQGEPIPFYRLIDEKTKDGVVHCLIYLLHLGNRRKIDLYQKIIENSDLENGQKRKRNGADSVIIPQVEDIIYVAPVNSEKIT